MVKELTRKTFTIRESGRSTDYIAPSFGFGCLLDCSYCYMKRHTNDKTLKYAKNINDVLTAVNNHVAWLPEKEPNQTDSNYYTYDIACNEDFALHSKYYDCNSVCCYILNKVERCLDFTCFSIYYYNNNFSSEKH